MREVQAGASRRSLVKSVAAAGFLAGCGASSTGASGPRVRIGFQKNGVLLLAKRSGRLEAALKRAPEAGLEWREFSSGPPLLEAMAVGSLDIGSTGDAPPVFAQAADAPIMYVACVPLTGAAGGVIVKANSPIQSIADLKGRRLCFTRGTSAHNAAAVLLEQAGLALNDVEHLNLAPADAAAAFAQGGMDACLIWDPYFTAALENGDARVIGTGGLPPSHAFILAHRDFVARDPANLVRVLNGLAEEGEWANGNRGEVAALQAQETNLPLALLMKTVERDDFTVRPITTEVIAAQQAIADRFLALGLLPKAVTIADAAYTGWTPT